MESNGFIEISMFIWEKEDNSVANNRQAIVLGFVGGDNENSLVFRGKEYDGYWRVGRCFFVDTEGSF